MRVHLNTLNVLLGLNLRLDGNFDMTGELVEVWLSEEGTCERRRAGTKLDEDDCEELGRVMHDLAERLRALKLRRAKGE